MEIIHLFTFIHLNNLEALYKESSLMTMLKQFKLSHLPPPPLKKKSLDIDDVIYERPQSHSEELKVLCFRVGVTSFILVQRHCH